MRWKVLATFCASLACMFGSASGATTAQNVVFIPKSSDHQFWELMHEGASRAMNESGSGTLTWRGPAHSGDVDAQIRILETYTRDGADAIVLAPIDRYKLEAPVKMATEKGIRVVVVDSELGGENHSSFFGTDNVAAGALAAEQMEKLLGGKGKLVVVRTYKGSVTVEKRVTGFTKHLKAHAPQIQIAADFYAGDAVGDIYSITKETLRRIQHIDAVFAPNETTAQASLRALRDLNLAGKIRFIGFDATPLLLDAIRLREVDGLVLQNPRQMGYLAVKAALESPVSASHRSPTVTYIPATMVTSENVAQPAIQELLARDRPQ
ncbi:substrate-binding domain-containing protein [Rhodoferax sp. GW822-FHT02A01]|uniref:substrate-binding domain-containing protein n=1 Tax=Rhodoferax sp. GW822-FHT02A01 TaxID=3141537 RepID=UPI00315CB936